MAREILRAKHHYIAKAGVFENVGNLAFPPEALIRCFASVISIENAAASKHWADSTDTEYATQSYYDRIRGSHRPEEVYPRSRRANALP